MKSSFLTRLFKELTYLNKVPKFQLERAISPLLGIFIKEIINKELESNVAFSIPEFPIKKPDNNQSTNIDWLLIDRKNKTLYFVELKTDILSFRVSQSNIYWVLNERLLKEGNAAFLRKELEVDIIPNSIRGDKYETILKKLNNYKVNLALYNKFETIYLTPPLPAIFTPLKNAKVLFLNKLPVNIKTLYVKEWHQLRRFLKTLSPQYEKNEFNQEGDLTVPIDLGIYSDDPAEDEKFNQDLIKFLDSQGYKRPKLSFKKDNN